MRDDTRHIIDLYRIPIFGKVIHLNIDWINPGIYFNLQPLLNQAFRAKSRATKPITMKAKVGQFLLLLLITPTHSYESLSARETCLWIKSYGP